MKSYYLIITGRKLIYEYFPQFYAFEILQSI